MKVERGAAQILFGMLPHQTIDLEGRVWQVTDWNDPLPLQLDQAGVRNAFLEAIAPWSVHGNDAGIDQELRRGTTVDVFQVNPIRGVIVDQFPQQWRCRRCGRLTTDKVDRCRCGSTGIAQMQHVAYHSCGALREPLLPRCPTHNCVAVRLPGTAAAREMYFYCPECRQPLHNGFPYQRCDCGESMTRNVHRAGAVFSPQYTVMVNPSDPAAAARLRATGGGARALEWVLDGLGKRKASEIGQTFEGLVDTLIQNGLSVETARELAEKALERGEITGMTGDEDFQLPQAVRERAQEEALSLASALELGRVRVDDMVEKTTPPLKSLYESAYCDAMAFSQLENVELLTNFPVATLAVGYTRGGNDPTETTFVPFRERGTRRLSAYGTLAHTEALLFQLNPVSVLSWLRKQGMNLSATDNPREARLTILREIEMPRPTDDQANTAGTNLITLLHSYAHRLVRVLSVSAGVERDGLAEYLLPNLLSIIIYASARGRFVLGALQAMFETHLHRVLNEVVYGEARCPLDPGCRSGGGACMACLHLGEPSCRWFNRFLDRAALFGDPTRNREGFLEEVRGKR